jgi:hypothetical protein
MSKPSYPLWNDRTLSLVSMYNGIDLKGKSRQKTSLQCLMLLDNIHDFSHNRTKYSARSFDRFCGGTYNADVDQPCIFEILFAQLNKKSQIFSQFGLVTPIFTHDMFKKTGWEKAYLNLLIKSGTTNLKWMSRKNFMSSFFVLNCWSHDSMRKGHSNIIGDFKKANSKDISLLTAHLDGCGGTCTTLKKGMKDIKYPIIFSLPFPEGDKVVTYKYTPSKKSLIRTFPKKYGKGGIFDSKSPKRECNCTPGDGTDYCVTIGGKNQCPYKRVDVLNSDLMPTQDPTTEDSIVKEGKELYSYLDHKFGMGKGVTFNDIEFFVTAKALSDIAQCAEAEQRGCFLLTQDTMQMIIGAKIGTRMVDHGNREGYVYMSTEAISGYVYDIHSFMKASGVPIPPKTVLTTKTEFFKWVDYFGNKVVYCLKCLMYTLSFIFTTYGIYKGIKYKID